MYRCRATLRWVMLFAALGRFCRRDAQPVLTRLRHCAANEGLRWKRQRRRLAVKNWGLNHLDDKSAYRTLGLATVPVARFTAKWILPSRR
jgi:hypothetical protein